MSELSLITIKGKHFILDNNRLDKFLCFLCWFLWIPAYAGNDNGGGLQLKIGETNTPIFHIHPLTYQYLYFGSERSSNCYLSHDEIFKNLRKICSKRIIFNNRLNLNDVQDNKCFRDANLEAKQNYSEEKIIAAASQYFTIQQHGKIGRYPLWTLEVKGDFD